MKTVLSTCIVFCLLITMDSCNMDPKPVAQEQAAIPADFSNDEARTWFERTVEASLRKNGSSESLSKSPEWQFGVQRSTDGTGDVLVVPIKLDYGIPIVSIREEGSSKKRPEKDMNVVSRFIIWKDSQKNFQYRLHHVIPTEVYRKKNPHQFKNDLTGMVLVTDFSGNFIEAVKLENGRQTKKLVSAGNNGRTSSCITYIVDWYTRVCVNNACYEPRWTHMEMMTACWAEDHGADGVTPPATVDQPIPGFRSINLNASNGSSPGHAYIGLEEYADGQAIVRTLGLHPKDRANPFQPEDQSSIVADDRYYDVALTIEVTQAQFSSIKTNLVAGSSNNYNLNTNNCTTYVCNAFNGTGINIPRTTGTWFNGGGLNPSDLGEDIRSMALSANMTRSTTGGYPPNRQGSCN